MRKKKEIADEEWKTALREDGTTQPSNEKTAQMALRFAEGVKSN